MTLKQKIDTTNNFYDNMIKVDLAFINNELKLNMDRLNIIRQNNSVSIEKRNKRI